jgi:LPS export ABC transporter protein LptC
VINEPKYTIHEKAGDWVFTSNIGEINKEQTELTFPQAVDLYLDVEEASKSVSVKTSRLVVDINNKIGRTDNEVIVKQPGVLLTGLGSVINFADQEIEIIEEMYAEFEN